MRQTKDHSEDKPLTSGTIYEKREGLILSKGHSLFSVSREIRFRSLLMGMFELRNHSMHTHLKLPGVFMHVASL